MRAVAATASVLAALSLATGCASRRPAPRVAAMVKVKPAEPALRTAAETKAGLEKAKKRTAYLPMLSDADAHKALPMWPKMMPVPNLARVGGLAPKSMQATLQSMMSERREGALDSALLGDVFWVVSNANDCFY